MFQYFLLYLFIKYKPILTNINEYNATNIYADITPNVPTKAYLNISKKGTLIVVLFFTIYNNNI